MVSFLVAVVLPFAFMFGFMYFILIRPQNKKEAKRREMITELQKGDRVRTQSGMIGMIKAVNETTFLIHSGNSDVEFLKESVSSKIEDNKVE